jgi:hypothetical protein
MHAGKRCTYPSKYDGRYTSRPSSSGGKYRMAGLVNTEMKNWVGARAK